MKFSLTLKVWSTWSSWINHSAVSLIIQGVILETRKKYTNWLVETFDQK